MKYCCFFFFIFICVIRVSSQSVFNGRVKNRFPLEQKTLSFNPFGLAEPQAAVGIGFNHRFTRHSGYFTELSYIFKTPFYTYLPNSVSGYKWLLQYRYYNKAKSNHFVAMEFRLKGYRFTGSNTLIKKSSNDTLMNFNYMANATSVGGAILAGTTFPVSSDDKWKIEITAGIGAKQKLVRYKNLPDGYTVASYVGGFGLKPPAIHEAVGIPYFPVCIRLLYVIN